MPTTPPTLPRKTVVSPTVGPARGDDEGGKGSSVKTAATSKAHVGPAGLQRRKPPVRPNILPEGRSSGLRNEWKPPEFIESKKRKADEEDPRPSAMAKRPNQKMSEAQIYRKDLLVSQARQSAPAAAETTEPVGSLEAGKRRFETWIKSVRDMPSAEKEAMLLEIISKLEEFHYAVKDEDGEPDCDAADANEYRHEYFLASHLGICNILGDIGAAPVFTALLPQVPMSADPVKSLKAVWFACAKAKDRMAADLPAIYAASFREILDMDDDERDGLVQAYGDQLAAHLSESARRQLLLAGDGSQMEQALGESAIRNPDLENQMLTRLRDRFEPTEPEAGG